MEITIGEKSTQGLAVVMNTDGEILGIVRYEPGQNIAPVLKEMVTSNIYEATDVTFEKTTIANTVESVTLEGVITLSNGTTEELELSFSPADVYDIIKIQEG